LKSHLEEAETTYGKHWYRSMGYSCRFLWLSIVACIHAFAPQCFPNTSSKAITKMYQDIPHVDDQMKYGGTA